MKKSERNIPISAYLGFNYLFYLSQAMYFIAIAQFLGSGHAPFQSLAILLVLAMVPFILVHYTRSTKLAQQTVENQLTMLVALRSGALFLGAFSLTLAIDKTSVIFATVLFFDLAFHIYAASSARVSKALSSKSGSTRLESLSFFTSQLGMASGSFLASLLLSIFETSNIFLICGVVQLSGLILVFPLKKATLQKKNEPPVTISAPQAQRKLGINAIGLLVALSALLPMQQILNLSMAPWSNQLLNDGGKRLGFISASLSMGALIAALLKSRLSQERAMGLLGPLLVISAIAAIPLLGHLFWMCAAAALLGAGISITRIESRATLIDVLSASQIPALMMRSTLASLSAALLFLMPLLIMSLPRHVSFVYSYSWLLFCSLTLLVGARWAQKSPRKGKTS